MNRQYVTTGNVAADDRVSLFLMDYARQRRLKIFGRLTMTDATADPKLDEAVAVEGYPAMIERAATVRVEAFDWNCPQHITPRFTQEELEQALVATRDEIQDLRAENRHLNLALRTGERPDVPPHALRAPLKPG